MAIDLALLRLIWWALIGVILIGFAITDGFDFGAAVLMPYVARNSKERLRIFAAIGPFWEGNQVWIILGAGALFAAWPFVYAVAFSGFYFVMLLLLLTMGISRPVSIKYRTKVDHPAWHLFWDSMFFIGGLVPAFLCGLLIGNVIVGAPFYFDHYLRIFYIGTLADLFSPFALLCGITSLFMLMMHGGLYLAIKTPYPMRERALFAAKISSLLFMSCFAIGGLALYQVKGLEITSVVDVNGFSNPLLKTVISKSGAWLNHFIQFPALFFVPAIAIVGALFVLLSANLEKIRTAFLASSLSIMCVIATVGVSLYPFILPSSYHPASSLLIWDASSTLRTLIIMLIAVMIFMPIILLYTAWVYRTLSGEVEITHK